MDITVFYIFLSWSSWKILKVLIMIYWSLGNNKEKVYLLIYITGCSNSDVSEHYRSFYCILFRVTVNVIRNKYYHCRSYAICYNILYIWKKRWPAKWQSLLPYIFYNGNDVNSHTVCNNAWRFSRKRKLMNYNELFTGDWRIFKKKKSIILPVLILLNLVKLKLLLLPIFLGVHFIKKLLVVGSLILPSVFAHLKICKVQHPHAHPYQIWSTAADTSADYPTGEII